MAQRARERSQVRLSLPDLPLRPDQLLELLPEPLRRRLDSRRHWSEPRSAVRPSCLRSPGMVTNQPYRPFGLSTGDGLTDTVRRVTGRWWLVTLLGVATTVLAICLLANLATAVGVLAVLVAIALIVDGVNELLTADRQRKRWPSYALGVIWIVIGVVALAWPGITLLALAATVGVGLIVGGVLQAGMAVTMRRSLPMWGLWLALGVLTVLVGILALAWPGLTILTLAIWLGVTLLLRGIGTIWFSLLLRRAHQAP
jgi:uncharacterized membrane protein HdeD (DUF308 family)